MNSSGEHLLTTQISESNSGTCFRCCETCEELCIRAIHPFRSCRMCYNCSKGCRNFDYSIHRDLSEAIKDLKKVMKKIDIPATITKKEHTDNNNIFQHIWSCVNFIKPLLSARRSSGIMKWTSSGNPSTGRMLGRIPPLPLPSSWDNDQPNF
ncbi:6366_t:CDS:2 [Acaulospora morrowiae]|uniref:6366_t:CDS:1 n=1 Tax=Acaulospora morrowiae TaxID=94023 RepID=A0A9N9I6H3_9GLOM|nr:6366_t:CDS:2 [Acaulospora morrowiae]